MMYGEGGGGAAMSGGRVKTVTDDPTDSREIPHMTACLFARYSIGGLAGGTVREPSNRINTMIY